MAVLAIRIYKIAVCIDLANVPIVSLLFSNLSVK